jgi:NAD(P)-dependent dehydrogenase (short-subunit alcohol dehydrogenase family)
MGRLQGKIVIVTGGASGIGAEACERAAAEGACVAVADLNAEGARARAEAIRARGGRTLGLAMDLGDESSIAAAIEATVTTFGGLDVLFNNAANTVLSSTRDFGIEQADFAVWDDTMRINLRGPAMAIKHAIPHLRRRGGGSIVNTASGAALRGADSPTAYGIGKAGLVALTMYAATQLGKDGIRCNAIAPGLIATPATRELASGPLAELMLRHHLTPRLGTPADVAAAFVWLASDEAAFVTGQCISVDGGLAAHMPYWAELRQFIACNADQSAV